jgi:hypothetical protein
VAIRSKPNPRVKHPLAQEAVMYKVGDVFLPGAGNEAYETPWELPVQLIRGPGRIAGALSVTQPPQVWFNAQVGLNGLGGLQAGQIILQPLLDPAQFEGD